MLPNHRIFGCNVAGRKVPLLVNDPNFGYETCGAVEGNCGHYIVGSPATCPEIGIAESITACVKADLSSGIYGKAAIYKTSNKSLLGNIIQHEVTNTTKHWETWNFATPKPTLENIEYCPVIWGNAVGASTLRFYCTAQAGAGRYQYKAYNSFPNPWSPTSQDYRYSIYVSYSLPPVAGGEYGLGKTELVLTL